MLATTPTLQRFSSELLDCLPRFTPAEQRLGLELYRQLANGRPVPAEELAAELQVPAEEVAALLGNERLRFVVYYDDQRRIAGFGGLAILPMHHRFAVRGRTLYTWCAWDALFIPELLGTQAQVESRCPETGETVELSVSPNGVERLSHPDAVVSFVLPGAEGFRADARKTMASFCHHVFFLASPQAGAAWAARNPGALLLTVPQAFELGKEKNALQFADSLPVRRR
jgi:alkylmercury lyase